MRGFIGGVLFGILLTGVVGAATLGPSIVGDDGYLTGWDIKVKTANGTLKCRDPFVTITYREMECKAR